MNRLLQGCWFPMRHQRVRRVVLFQGRAPDKKTGFFFAAQRIARGIHDPANAVILLATLDWLRGLQAYQSTGEVLINAPNRSGTLLGHLLDRFNDEGPFAHSIRERQSLLARVA